MAERVEFARKLCSDAFGLYGRPANRPEEEELWKQAAALFHRSIEEAYHPEFREHWKQLEQGNIAGLNMAITFLERDPWFFRSGYIKADLIRMVCRLPLTVEDSSRLQKIVLAAIGLRDRREFRSYSLQFRLERYYK